MNLHEKIKILTKLGLIFDHLAEDKPWGGFDLGLTEEEYQALQLLVANTHIYNGWFTADAIKTSLKGMASWLTEDELLRWTNNYKIQEHPPKTVGIVMAGNIPMVGFHDLLTVFLSGNIALIKMSSDDDKLIPGFLLCLKTLDERISDYVRIASGPLKEFDAVIATGSDNSARYFESYFSKHPHIIRKNRNSVAIINGSEDKETLKKLGEDIFTYFGLGCRNVTQLMIPEDFELNLFFEAIYDFNQIINHNKYANNYDYNKAIFLLNETALLDNGFILLKEDENLHSPLGMLHYQRYKSQSEVDQYLENHKDQIQVVIGENYTPFGLAQQPKVDDYADGVDTMKFLVDL